MNLQDLPDHLFTLIIEELVVSIGIFKSVRLRAVSRPFNAAILHTICVSKVVDINDPATPTLHTRMSQSLKGKILLVKSHSHQAANSRVLSVIANVNQELDNLTRPDEKRQIEQYFMISEAIANLDRTEVNMFNQCNQEIDEKMEAQNALSSAIIIGNLSLVTSLLTKTSLAMASINMKSPYFGQPLQLAPAWDHV